MYADVLRQDFSAFSHRSFLELNSGTPFLPNWHIDVLASTLEEVRSGWLNRVIINIPPRHLKSHATSIAFPAWLLGHRPTAQILCISYAQDLSDNLARQCRTLMTSSFYQALFDTRLAPGREAVSDFSTNEGGYRLSTSIGGVVTGRGADIIVIDDPLKADDALSEARRRSVNEWYDNTLRSRLNSQERGVIIIVMQRLHVDDLVGHVQQHERWDVLSFPAIAEQADTYPVISPYGKRTIHREAGSVLHPKLLSRVLLDNTRRAMTEYNFTAQYQQDPQPLSGNVVKRAWLKFYKPEEEPDRFEMILQSWDTANKETELANFSVCTTWGVHKKHLYLLNVFREKLEFPDLKRAVVKLANSYEAKVVLIEDRASGTQLIQQLRADRFSRVEAAPTLDGDKIMRLRAQTAKFEGGFVLLPKEPHWLADYVGELLSFPNSKYDDQVDSTVFALAWFTDKYRPHPYTEEAIDGLIKVTLGRGSIPGRWR